MISSAKVVSLFALSGGIAITAFAQTSGSCFWTDGADCYGDGDCDAGRIRYCFSEATATHPVGTNAVEQRPQVCVVIEEKYGYEHYTGPCDAEAGPNWHPIQPGPGCTGTTECCWYNSLHSDITTYESDDIDQPLGNYGDCPNTQTP